MALPVSSFLGKSDPSRFFCADPFFSIFSCGIASGEADSFPDPGDYGRTSFERDQDSPCVRRGCIPRYSTFAPASRICRRKTRFHNSRTKLPVQRPGSFPKVNGTGRIWGNNATLASFWHGDYQPRKKLRSRVDSGSSCKLLSFPIFGKMVLPRTPSPKRRNKHQRIKCIGKIWLELKAGN